jgi:hypothetical protein
MARETSNALGAAFSRFEHSAFRLETLDRYTVPDEAQPFRRFLAGEPHDPSWRDPWAGFVREAATAGKTMTRIHLVDEPLSDYLHFELTCGYPANVEAGEDIRIFRRQANPGLNAWGDFWLFDDREIAVMNYGPEGDFRGASVSSEPSDAVEMHCEMRDLFWERSVPLADYLAKL